MSDLDRETVLAVGGRLLGRARAVELCSSDLFKNLRWGRLPGIGDVRWNQETEVCLISVLGKETRLFLVERVGGAEEVTSDEESVKGTIFCFDGGCLGDEGSQVAIWRADREAAKRVGESGSGEPRIEGAMFKRTGTYIFMDCAAHCFTPTCSEKAMAMKKGSLLTLFLDAESAARRYLEAKIVSPSERGPVFNCVLLASLYVLTPPVSLGSGGLRFRQLNLTPPADFARPRARSRTRIFNLASRPSLSQKIQIQQGTVWLPDTHPER